ncbi:MAG: hypothetical protein ACQEP1_05120 [Nanobdellota archaeon]
MEKIFNILEKYGVSQSIEDALKVEEAFRKTLSERVTYNIRKSSLQIFHSIIRESWKELRQYGKPEEVLSEMKRSLHESVKDYPLNLLTGEEESQVYSEKISKLISDHCITDSLFSERDTSYDDMELFLAKKNLSQFYSNRLRKNLAEKLVSKGGYSMETINNLADDLSKHMLEKNLLSKDNYPTMNRTENPSKKGPLKKTDYTKGSLKHLRN